MRIAFFFPALLLCITLNAQQWNWATQGGGTSNDDLCYGIATDSHGNVYWVGTARGSSTFDCATISVGNSTAGVIAKYDSTGLCQWVRHISTLSIDARVNAIAIDAEDRIYIAGSYHGNAHFGDSITLNGSGDADIFLARYDTEGHCLWARRAGGQYYYDEVRGIALSDDGDIFIAGRSGGDPIKFYGITIANPGEHRQIVLARYDSTGTVQWARASTGADDDKSARGISIVGDRLFITGRVRNTTEYDGLSLSPASSGGNLYVMACDLAGNALWTSSYGPTASEGMGIAADTLGNLFVAGRLLGSLYLPDDTLSSVSYNDDILLMGFDQDGQYRWAKSAGSPDRDLASGVTVDNKGNAYMAMQFNETIDFLGTSVTALGDEDALIAKVRANGDLVWTSRPSGYQRDIPLCIHRRSVAPHTLYFGGYFWGIITYGSSTIDDVLNGDAMLVSGMDTTFDVSLHASWVCPGACDGDATAFTNGTGPFTYSWSGGSSSPMIDDLCPGTYTVAVTDANGQVHIDTVQVEEFADPGYMVQVQNDSLRVEGGTAWQWFFNDNALPGDSSLLIAQETGSYHALITDTHGCIWNSDTVLVVLGTGVAAQRSEGLHVWPNPVSGQFSIQLEGTVLVHADLLNSVGQRVRSLVLQPGMNAVDLKGVDSGLYVLLLEDGRTVRVVVQ